MAVLHLEQASVCGEMMQVMPLTRQTGKLQGLQLTLWVRGKFHSAAPGRNSEYALQQVATPKAVFGQVERNLANVEVCQLVEHGI